ncbi:MAG: DUF3667 domain-containing protein [Marinifilaceae bacterium]
MSRRNKRPEIKGQKYTCKNCNTEFIGKFCPNCSQSVKEFEQPIGFMIVDFVGNMFAFDTRFWKTFKAVLYQPGHMANSFVEGHRVRYMPPFRFYIFISFIFFFLLNYNISNNFQDQMSKENGNISITDSLKRMEADSIIRAELVNKFGKKKTDSIVAKIQKEFIYKEKSEFIDVNIENNISDDDDLKGIKFKKLYKDAKAHPEYYISKVLTYISWSLFLLMPFFAFLLWVFFRKSYRFYIIHLIFAINQHAFLFIILSLITTISIIFPAFISVKSPYLLLLLPIYHYIGGKQLYKQTVKTTILRLITIGLIYWFIVLIGIAIMIFLWIYFGYINTIKIGSILKVLLPITAIVSLSIYLKSKIFKKR